MNMYAHPDYRRQGIASKTLGRLLGAAKVRGVDQVSLEATTMGRPLYERFGFVAAKYEMVLKP